MVQTVAPLTDKIIRLKAETGEVCLRKEREMADAAVMERMAMGANERASKPSSKISRNLNDQSKERIHLSLTKTSLQRLDLIKEKTEASSYAEVLKNALRLYEAFLKEAEEGKDFFVKDKEGNVTSYRLAMV